MRILLEIVADKLRDSALSPLDRDEGYVGHPGVLPGLVVLAEKRTLV